MKRDKQLIRQVLEYFEEHGTSHTIFCRPWDDTITGRSGEEVEYHAELSKHSGYFQLKSSGHINMLSEYGHDTLDAMRGD